MKKFNLIIMVFVGLAFVGTSYAISIKQRLQSKENADRMKKDVAKMNQACGSKITVTYELATEVPDLTPGGTYGRGYTVCAEVAKGIGYVCETPEGKEAVNEKLKAVNCKFEEGSHKKVEGWGPELSMKDGVLQMKFEWNSSNITNETMKWLNNNL